MNPNFELAYLIYPNGKEIKIPPGVEHWSWVIRNTKVKNLDELFDKEYIPMRGDSFRCNNLSTAEARIKTFVRNHFNELPEECLVSEYNKGDAITRFDTFGVAFRLMWTVHSQNPIATREIIMAMKSAERFWDRNES